MKRGYIRVSTKGQARDGNSLSAQKEALKEAGATEFYVDTFTGTKMERPEFERLMRDIQEGDTLYVTKIDRLARSVSQASGLITDLIDRGITVNVLNLGVLSNSSVDVLLRNVLLAFAQFERDMIVQRTSEGKQIAKENNPDYKEGRPPKYDKDQLDNAMNLLETHSISQTVKLTGISRATIMREKKKRREAFGATMN